MNRTILAACLIAAVPVASGCSSSFQIPLAEVPQLSRGVVHTDEGDAKTIDDHYSVRLVPHDGAVLLRPDQAAPALVAVPRYDMDRAPANRFSGYPWLEGPVTFGVGNGYLFVSGVNDSVAVPIDAVAGLRIKQFSPGKTAGLVVGGTVAGLVVGSIVAFGAMTLLSSSGGFLLNHGY